MRRFRIELESAAAGLVTATLVAGLIALSFLWGWLESTEEARWGMVILAPLVGLIVGAQYRKNRGLD